MAEKQNLKRKNRASFALQSKIMGRVIVLLVAFLAVLPMISAADFDNWKFYNEDTKTITIKNAFGLGATIAEITLLDNTYYCLTNCYFDVDFIKYVDDYEDPISALDFYKYISKSKTAETNLNYKVLLRSASYEVDVDDYSISCKEKALANGTIEKDCSKSKSGSHKETRYNYVDYNGNIKKNVHYYFRVEGKKGAKDDVEWIMTAFNNQKLTEWASWNSTYNQGLQSYNAFDGLGFNNSISGLYNLTDNSAGRIIVNSSCGINGGCADGRAITSVTDYLNFTRDYWETTNNGTINMTVSFWFNIRGNTTNSNRRYSTIARESARNSALGYTQYIDLSPDVQNYNFTYYWGGGTAGGGEYPIADASTYNFPMPVFNRWYHVVMQISNTTFTLYLNNTNVTQRIGLITTTNGGVNWSGRSYLFLGAAVGNQPTFNLTIDEFAVWNRTLSSAEIADLYSNGSGIFYTPTVVVPNLNITYPLNATYTTNVSSLNYTVNGTGIQACWYSLNNGATNTTITCGQNATGLTSNLGSNTWRVYANNTQGIGSAVVSFNITPYTNAVESFNNITTEGNTEIFVLNLTLSSGFTISVPRLIYNNTLYAGTVENIAGNNYSLKRVLVIPNVGARTNYTFYWSILFSEGSIYNTTTNNQTVLNLSIDDCSSYQTIIVNYTIRDEETQAVINSSYYNTTIELDLQIYPVNSETAIINFSKSYPNTSQVCLESLTNLSEYRLYSQAKYYADLYVKRNHYLQNFTLRNTTIPQNINLFDLKTSKATQFLVTFKDSSFLAVAEALININKKYVSEGVFKTVEIEKTDDFGQTIAYFDLANALYSIVVTKEGRILATFDNIAVFCEDIVAGLCKINLDASAATSDAVDFNTYNNLQYGERFNSTTRIYAMSFNTYDNSAQTISINLTKFDMYGNSTICSNSVYTSSGTLACTVPQSYNNLTFSSTIYINNQPASTSYYVIQPLATETFSGSLVIFTVGLILTLGVMMIPNVIMVVIGTMIGFGIAVTLFYISGTVLGTSFILLVVIAAIIIWRARQGGSD